MEAEQEQPVKKRTKESGEQSGIERSLSVREQRELNRIWRTFAQDRAAVIGLVVTLAMAALAVLAPVLPLASPTDMDLPNRAAFPTVQHPMGTDFYGRDVLSRIIWGGRISLQVGIVSVLSAALLGMPAGLVGAYLGGWVDSVLMRFMDTIYTFPPVLLAIVVVSMRGPGINNVMLALGLIFAPDFARLARASALSVMQQEYILAARVIGVSPLRLVLRHILPNVSAPLLVRASVQYAGAILTESGLSFLGLGPQPPTPSWGSMLNEARGYLMQAPWYPFFPGLTIVIATLSLTLVGDGLTIALDPRRAAR
jgi:peptide/nickel transport system permease protein